MAKKLQAKVSKTSGQGISRLAYQQAYAMKGGLTSKFSAGKQQSTRDYPKQGQVKPRGGINISYGDTLEPTDIKDINATDATLPTKASVSLKPAKAKTWL